MYYYIILIIEYKILVKIKIKYKKIILTVKCIYYRYENHIKNTTFIFKLNVIKYVEEN